MERQKMELTGRQHAFLSKLIDLYRAALQPLPYSTVAEQLGVSPMTAYDMLRLLEERGLARSEYVLHEGGGPGRSNIRFSPTDKALALLTQLAGEDWDQAEWQMVKERILDALRQGQATDYQGLVDDMLLRLPESHSPMTFVTEMIAAILLTVNELVGGNPKDGRMFDALRSVGLPEELGLNALAGLMLGVSFVERANRSVTSRLLSYSRTYQEHLATLSADCKARLTDFAGEIMSIIKP
jgi:DNA-binding PadR family transcriptional regulator